MTGYDALDRSVADLHPRGAFLYRSELSAPWGMTVPQGEAAFHVVERGGCLVEVEGQTQRIEAGDLLVRPRGSAAAFRSAPDATAVPIADLVARHGLGPDGVLRVGSAPDPTHLVCGRLDFDDGLPHPILDALPPLVLARGAGEASPWLRQTVAFLACEASGGRMGARAVMGHLGSILFVQAVRAYAAGGAAGGWIGALGDAHIGPALRAVLDAPERPWTIERLGREAGLGRSAFAARFRQQVGETPMQHVARWRIYRAGRLLRTDLTLADVAARVGYENEAAFGRAFKRWTGRTPGTLRRAQGGTQTKTD